MKKLLLFFAAALCSAGYVDAQCVASFTSTAAPSGNNLLNYDFSNTSSFGLPFTGQLKSYQINYGDGSAWTSVNNSTAIPSHSYTVPGTYTVGLRIYSYDSITNTQLCTDTVGHVINVAYPGCGTTMNVTGTTGGFRAFTATTVGGSTGMNYSWTFGDGGTATGASTNHTYTAAGSYTVTLVATGTGCSYTNTRTIYISLPPAALNCSTLSASFNVSVAGNVLTTVNTSSTVSSPYVMTATWAYGDGATATGMNPPAHVYASTGVYYVGMQMIWRDSFYNTYCQDTTVRLVTVSSIPAPANIISGQVRYDSLTYGINNFKVWLIKLDSATNTLYAVDSQITANTANAYYAFANKAAGIYRTKAAVYLGASAGTGLYPTYHDTSVYWNTALLINHTGGSSLNRNINMRSGTLSAGPGFIGGNVSFGANKGAATGVPGVTVYLRDKVEHVVAMARTDASGRYSFPNIPLGAYSIYPEIINVATTPATPIVLSAATTSTYSAADFSYDEARRTIIPHNSLSVGATSNMAGVYVSPVPAHETLSIRWSNAADGEQQFVVTSATGQLVTRTESLRGVSGTVNLNVSKFAPGIYFLYGTGALRGTVTRFVVQ
jgi:PKD repeat protein